MNYFASAASGDHGDNFSLIHPDSHFGDAIVVPDSDLLIHGHYHRAGLDLVLTGHDGGHHVIPGYFASEHPPSLAAPNGAHFSADLVGLLAGSPAPHEYAQAQGQAAAAADSIGKIQKITGDVTVQRNGVSVALNVGDVVYKSDVIVTGTDSKCGLTFPDGTALELLPNTRMALNEYDYDAKSTSNQALFTLVEGTFGFVAGKVAHTGDMKIGTPVATMGIRGTTGVVQEVNSTTGEITYSYSVYDDFGTTHSGSWDMFVDNPDGTQSLALTISQPGFVTFVTSRGLHEPRFVSTVPLTASQLNADQFIIIDLADLGALAGPHSIGIPGSGDNPLLIVPPHFFPELFGNGGTTTYNYQPPPLPSPPPPQNPQNPSNPVASNVFIWPMGNSIWPTGGQWNQGFAPNAPVDIVIIESGTVTYNLSDPFTIFSLTIDGPGQNGGQVQGELQMSGGELIVTNGLTVSGELFVGNGDPPRFLSYGPATILSGGQVIASGKGSTIEFMPDPSNPGAPSVIVENFGAVRAEAGGVIKFIDALVINEPAPASTGDSESAPQPGIIEATGKGSLVKFKDSILFNAGTVAAEHGGTVKFVDGSTINNDPGSFNTETNAETAPGEIESIGRGSLVLFKHSSLDNFGIVAAEFGGKVEFLHAGTVTNAPETTPLSGGDVGSPAGEIESTGWGSDVSFVHTDLDNFGLVIADCYGAITFYDAKIVNEPSLITGATPAPAGLIEAEFGGFIGVDGGKIINDKGASIDAKYGGVIDIGWADVENHRGALIEASHHGEIGLFDADLDNKGTIKSEDCSCISIVGCDDGSVVNVGLIEARSFGEVKFDGLGSVVNDDGGEIEAKDHGTILFEDVVATNYDGGTDSGAGLIAADGCGSTVELANASIDGGTVQSRDGGKIEAIYGDNEFLDVTINGGIVQVDRHATLALEGHTVIEKDTTFEGHGVFVLDGDNSITGEGSAVTLKNDSTIAGGGTIGGDGLKLINEAWGTILADGGKNDPLVINTGTNKVINDGLMEAVGPSALDIDSKLDNYGQVIAEFGGSVVDDANVVNEAGGRIEALDGGTVTLDGSKIVNDGSGECAPAGLIMADGRDSEVLIKSPTVDNDGKIEATNGGVVDIVDAKIYNEDGRIDADGWGSAVVLAGSDVLDGGVSLDHHGALNVTGDSTLDNVDVSDSTGANIDIEHGAVLTLDDGTIISGHGKLTIEHGGTLAIESSDGATLDGVDVVNHGTIKVDAPVDADTVPLILDGGMEIAGGQLLIGSEGLVHVEDSGATFDGLTVDVSAGGEIEVGSPPPQTHSLFESDVTSGSTLTLLTLDDDAIISGGTLAIELNGEVDVAAGGRGSSATLESLDILNSGLLQVERGALLTLEGVTEEGGTLLTLGNPYSHGGVIEISAIHGETVFDGTANAVTEEGYVKVAGGADLELKGTIDVDNNNDTTFGIIELDQSNSSGGTLKISGTVTLGGTDGEVVLEGGDASIVAAASGAVLDNEIDIYGGGNIGHDGDGSLTFNNSGLVFADDGTAAPILIDTGNDVTNTGTLEANDGVLIIDDNIVDNNMIVGANHGTVVLNGDTVSGGEISINSTSTLKIENGATILSNVDVENSGNLVIDSGSIIATLDVDTGSTIHGGTITIDGAGELDVLGGTFDSVTIDDKGIFDIDGPLTIAGDITIDIDGGTFTDAPAGVLTVAEGTSATLSGVSVGTVDVEANATFTLDNADAAVVDFTGSDATLVLDTPSSFSGTVKDLAVGDTIDFANVGTVTSAVFNGSTLDVNGTSINISGLSASSYDFYFKPDGAHGTDFVVEAAPAVTITTPIAGDGIFNASEAAAGFTFQGTASDTGVDVDGQTVTVDIFDSSDTIVDSFTTTVNAGAWTLDVPSSDKLADGTYTVTANLTDWAIDSTSGASQTFTVDETAPTLTINAINGNDIINAADAAGDETISGTASDAGTGVNNQTVTVEIVNSSNVVEDTLKAVVTNGAWSADLTTVDAQGLADGSYKVVASVSDVAGNQTTTTELDHSRRDAARHQRPKRNSVGAARDTNSALRHQCVGGPFRTR